MDVDLVRKIEKKLGITLEANEKLIKETEDTSLSSICTLCDGSPGDLLILYCYYVSLFPNRFINESGFDSILSLLLDHVVENKTFNFLSALEVIQKLIDFAYKDSVFTWDIIKNAKVRKDTVTHSISVLSKGLTSTFRTSFSSTAPFTASWLFKDPEQSGKFLITWEYEYETLNIEADFIVADTPRNYSTYLYHMDRGETPEERFIWRIQDRARFVDSCRCGKHKVKTTPCCEVCIKEYYPTGKLINSYSTKAPQFMKEIDISKKEKYNSNDQHFYGVELELNNNPDTLTLSKQTEKVVTAIKHFLIAKRDGSVPNGIEFVTTPATYTAHVENFKKIFEAIKGTSFVADSNCGIHIHVGRKKLSPLQLGRISEFIYNPDNKPMIVKIAGRDSAFSRFNSNTNLYSFAPAYNSYGHERYSAINVNNKDTIEFRIFSSTTDFMVFCRYLEFVKSLICYTSPDNCKVNIKEIKDLKMYLNFVKTSKYFDKEKGKPVREYPNLYDFLIKEGFVSPPKTTKDIV